MLNGVNLNIGFARVLPRDLRQYSNRKVFIALGAIIGFAFVTTAATVIGLTALLIYRQGAQNYNDGRLDVQIVVSDVYRASALTREFVLTGNQADLESYRQLKDKLPVRLKAAEEDSTPVGVVAQVDRLRPLTEQILNEQDRAIAAYRAGDPAGATAILDAGQEANLIGQLVSASDIIQAGAVAQLEADRARINLLAHTSRDISILSLLITLILAVVVYYLYLKGIQAERRLDRAKDDFVSLASHQLRTPATGVKSILAMLVSGDVGPLSPRQLHFAHKALESNERGLSIIEELLDVAKADAGRLVLNPTTFDLSDLVTAIVIEQQPLFTAKDIKISIKVPTEPAEMHADRDKLYMAIGNVVDNARKYTPIGGRVDVALVNRSREMRIIVLDNGPGIPKDELSHIFDRFGRSTAAQNAEIEGTGLGLYLVSRVVELHHGRMKVSSKPGKGSKFVMIVPKRSPQP